MWTPLPASTSPGGGTTDTCPGSPLIAARSAAGLLPGVTPGLGHVRGVAGRSLRVGAPCSHQLLLHLDPVPPLESEYPGPNWATLSKPSLIWVLRALHFFGIRCSRTSGLCLNNELPLIAELFSVYKRQGEKKAPEDGAEVADGL